MQTKCWIFDLTPNLVYVSVNINHSWGLLRPMTKFQSFWKCFGTPAVDNLKHIRFLGLTFLDDRHSSKRVSDDARFLTFNRIPDQPWDKLVPEPFYEEKSPTPVGPSKSSLSSRIDRGGIGAWECSLPHCFCLDDGRVTLVLQCLFQLKPRPDEQVFSRSMGGPFATARLENFYNLESLGNQADVNQGRGPVRMFRTKYPGLGGDKVLNDMMGLEIS